MQDVRNLRAWHAATALTVEVVQALPPRTGRKVPGLRSQAIRAAMSVPANLAEGCARNSRAELLHFVEIAAASAGELEIHLQLALETRVISPPLHARLARDTVLVRRMLGSLARAIRARLNEER